MNNFQTGIADTYNPPNIKNYPIYPKSGRVNNVATRYVGYGTDGQLTQYEASAVASILDAPDMLFTFSCAPMVHYRLAGHTTDGWTRFVGECGEVHIPRTAYEKLMQVHGRTVRGRKRSGRGNPSSSVLFDCLDALQAKAVLS